MARTSFWKGRRVLVTGGAGFIGYALATKLVLLGARVYVLDIKPSLPPSALADEKTRVKITYVRGSVTSRKTLDGILKGKRIRTIFHLAAEAIVGRANKNPERTLRTNMLGTWTLLESARGGREIKEIVVASSDKAYGSHEKLPYKEDAALQGLNPYDCSKSGTDLIAQMYARSFDMPITIARCGNVYGPGDTNWSRLIPDAFRSVAKGRMLDIRSDGTFKRDYIYIDDIVEAYIVLGERTARKGMAGEAFNFGNNKPLQVLHVLEEILRVTPNLRYRILNTARNEICDQYLNASKARRVLGWRARTNIRSGFRKTAAWYARYSPLHDPKHGA